MAFKSGNPIKKTKDVTKAEAPKSRGKPKVSGPSLGPGSSLPKPPPMASFNDINPSRFQKPDAAFEDPVETGQYRPDPEMNAMSKSRGKKLGTSVPMYAQNEHEAHRADVRKTIKDSIKEIKRGK